MSQGRLWEFVRAGVISEAQCAALLGVDGTEADATKVKKVESQAEVEAVPPPSGGGKAVCGREGSGKKAKASREMAWEKFEVRRIALKVAYLGWGYAGFASQVPSQGTRTVEDALFEALVSTRLVRDVGSCGYSRCGRTDKGVSALGQVVALEVRSARRSGAWRTRGRQKEAEAEVEDDGWDDARDEIDYVSTLNRALPDDVQVLGWADVGPDFHARFSATWRHYKYVFCGTGLDVGAMQRAAASFLGRHDFRNFCKMDVGNVRSFEREIFECCIVPSGGIEARLAHEGLHPHDATDMVPGVAPGGEGARWATGAAVARGGQLWEFNVRGSAFLWHMVRCMMAVLFMVGEGLEGEGIVAELLDVSGTYASKPLYPMAADAPLLLYACGFRDGQAPQFKTSPRAIRQLDRLFFVHVGRSLVRTAVSATVLSHWSKHLLSGEALRANRERALDDEAMHPLCLHHDIPGQRIRTLAVGDRAAQHVPLRARPREFTHEVAIERLHLKKQRLVLNADEASARPAR